MLTPNEVVGRCAPCGREVRRGKTGEGAVHMDGSPLCFKTEPGSVMKHGGETFFAVAPCGTHVFGQDRAAVAGLLKTHGDLHGCAPLPSPSSGVAEALARHQRELAIKAHLNGMSVGWIATTFGVDRKVVASWLDAYSRRHGMPGGDWVTQTMTDESRFNNAEERSYPGFSSWCPKGHGIVDLDDATRNRLSASLKREVSRRVCPECDEIPVWTGAKGVLVPIAAMSDKHLGATIAMLERNARAQLRRAGADEERWRETAGTTYRLMIEEERRRFNFKPKAKRTVCGQCSGSLQGFPGPLCPACAFTIPDAPTTHLDFEEIGDAALGLASFPHLETCESCRKRVKVAVGELASLRAERGAKSVEKNVEALAKYRAKGEDAPGRGRAARVAMAGVFASAAVLVAAIGGDVIAHAFRLYFAWLLDAK